MNDVLVAVGPGSRKLAVVTVEAYEPMPMPEVLGPALGPKHIVVEQQPAVLVWWALDVRSGAASRLAQFFPSGQQLALLQSFDRYS